MSDRRRPTGEEGHPIPQFDEVTNPQSDLESTVDIQTNELEDLVPLADSIDEDTINLPRRIAHSTGSQPLDPAKATPQGDSIEPRPAFPTSSQTPDVLDAGNSRPGQGNAAEGKPPWWAFWRKGRKGSQETKEQSLSKPPWWALGQQRQRRKQMSTTSELPKFQWDTKTEPKARLPVSLQASSQDQASPSHPPVEESRNAPLPARDTAATGAFSFWLKTALALLFVVVYSIPLWLTPWPPMSDFPAQVGLLQYAAQSVDASAMIPWEARPSLYVGLLSDMLFSAWIQWVPSAVAMCLLLQISMLLSLLALGFLLHSAGRPLWNLLLGFPFLYSGALFVGETHFHMALPFVLFATAALYQWLARRKFMYGLLCMAISWLLLFLHLEAYIIFLVIAFCACMLLGQSWGERLYSLAFPGSSLLLFLPWIAILWSTLPSGPSATVLASVKPRFLGIWDALTLPTYDGYSDLVNLGLLLVVWGGIAAATSAPTGTWSSNPNHPPETPAIRAFFPVVSLSMLVLYLGLPQQWYGYTLSTTTPLVLMMLVWVGWVHMTSNTNLGRFLILGTVVVSAGYGWHLYHSYETYAKEVSSLQSIIQRVPSRRNMLVWQPPASKVFKTQYHQAGGYYMFFRNGVSNLDLKRSLKWRRLAYHNKHKAPSPLQRKTPKLGRWQYLLTGKKPPRSMQAQLKLFVTSGAFRIYQRKLPAR